MKTIRQKAPIMFPTNVTIIQKSTDGRLLNKYDIKNRVLKTFGLYSYCRFIIGDFYNNNLLDEGQYIPKYLAVGSNSGELNGAPGTETTVKITDVSLYHELTDDTAVGEDNQRIKLNRANYVEDNADEPYLKIQYEAYIPEDRFVNQTIGELGLMTGKTGFNAFARIAGIPSFVKTPNSVVQIIWEITILSIESSTRMVPPIKTYLRESIEKAIDVLEKFTTDPIEGARNALNKLIEPATVDTTGLYYLLNDNEFVTQDVINSYLSAPFKTVDETGLIPLIALFDPDWAETEMQKIIK